VWFVVVHPAFYEGKTEIVFAKKKVDMLHKDINCKKAGVLPCVLPCVLQCVLHCVLQRSDQLT